MLAAVIAAAWFYRDRAAEREWREYTAGIRARGLPVTYSDLKRPLIPEAENFAALPMFKAAFASTGEPPNPFKLPAPAGSVPWPGAGDPRLGEPADWTKAQTVFHQAGLIDRTTNDPVADVLRGLEKYDASVAEWRQWRSRPRCVFPVDWSKGKESRIPIFGLIQDASKLFALRLRAHIAQGNSDEAFSDFEDGLQASRSIEDVPTMIAGLVQVAVLKLILEAAGDGLADRAWSTTEMEAIEEALRRTDLPTAWAWALQSERCFANDVFDRLHDASGSERMAILDRSASEMDSPTILFAWTLSDQRIRRTQLRTNRFLEAMAARARAGQIYQMNDLPGGIEDDPSFIERWWYRLFYETADVYGFFDRPFLGGQALLDQTRLAIALERHRAVHGGYPGGLEKLVPEFLPKAPVDPWTQTPIRYEPTPDGESFRLYFVGMDGRDDGGAVDPKKAADRQKDAIWLYAPRPAAH